MGGCSLLILIGNRTHGVGTFLIEYSLSVESDVTIEIYDILGQKVKSFTSENRQPGQHSVTWNADNVASGIYFYKITASGYNETKRMTLLK